MCKVLEGANTVEAKKNSGRDAAHTSANKDMCDILDVFEGTASVSVS